MELPVLFIRGEIVAIIKRRHKTEALVCWCAGDGEPRFFVCEVRDED